jgi:hypothetical protein
MPSADWPTTLLIFLMINTTASRSLRDCTLSLSKVRSVALQYALPTFPTTPPPRSPDPTLPEPVQDRDAAVGARLKDFAGSFRASLAAGGSTDPVLAAVVHTVTTCGIDPECFDRFFEAMAIDLTTTSYQSWEDLRG